MNIEAGIKELDKIVNEHPVLRSHEQRIRVKFNDLRRILEAMGSTQPLQIIKGKIPEKDHKHYCNNGQKSLELETTIDKPIVEKKHPWGV